MNSLGFTSLEMFLAAYGLVFRKATVETVNHLLSLKTGFDKSKWNTYLQSTYGINKRQSNSIIAFASGKVDSSKKCRINHIKQLEGKLKSALAWLSKSEKKLKNARKFYAKKNWQQSKTGCAFPLDCSLKDNWTNWKILKFQIHNKKRYIYKLSKQILYLKQAPFVVTVPSNEVFFVGSKDESFGNQICQWDGNTIKLRVPYCLKEQFGEYVTGEIGNFDRNINRLPGEGAKTWHFYRKDNKWVCACQFTPSSIKPVSRPVQYGCIGIDMNPGSIGWSYVDCQGNFKQSGTIPLQTGLPTGKQDSNLVSACLQLAILANTFSCPIVCENLDFSSKKEQLRESSRKYARMLSGWAYSRFYELLESILSNRGLTLIKRNPAYTSLIGLSKYSRMYGLPSDIAAAVAIARRGMGLSERLPRSVSAYLEVKPRKHVWSGWKKFNNFVGQCAFIKSRHDYYRVSNWELLVKVYVERVTRRQR
jgi:IS605 OrfB family transposase